MPIACTYYGSSIEMTTDQSWGARPEVDEEEEHVHEERGRVLTFGSVMLILGGGILFGALLTSVPLVAVQVVGAAIWLVSIFGLVGVVVLFRRSLRAMRRG